MSVAVSIVTPDPPSRPWRAIGTEPGKGTETLYIFEVDGDLVKLRQPVLASFGGVMSLDPDPMRWAALFPSSTRKGRFDLAAVVGFLMQQCRIAQRQTEAARSTSGDRTSRPSERTD